ncbi:hypothetical protein F0L74_21770 [Chitinophaga agrisoli]|uniref:Uncharacterized protein n=1 Tax=Chitinophaga agrisoli TaxID=2607653 RepID=A0A5B2VJX2_9BACT|nr:hypothetical protein [Chitinophaga agrisoli]KAA2238846.1 hypothetical protein F0L74_21770 [Chitinophaga agrisoli]
MIFKFAVLKKGIGIAMFIDVEELRSPQILDSDLSVLERIYLRVNHPIPFLSEEDIDKYVVQAIRDVSNEIYEKIGGSQVCFYIQSLDTNAAHFQEEGIYCAMRGWLAQYYGLNVPPVKIELDEEKRKFVFNFLQ